MNVNNSIFVLISLIFVISGKNIKIDWLVFNAMQELLVEFFATASAKVDVINFGKRFDHGGKLAENILRNKPDDISVQVSQFKLDQAWKYQLNISSLLFFDSPQNFIALVKKIKWLSDKRMRYKHLVHVPNLIMSDIVENIQDGFSIDNVNFLMNETEESIDLVSSFMFTSKKCRSNQLVTINRFTRNQRRWENSNFYPEKYKNFHNCKLSVSVVNLKPGKYDGLFNDISEIYNFSIELENFNLQTQTSKADLLSIPGQFDGDKRFITSVPYFYGGQTFAVPPGEPFTSFEKMFMMFDVDVWKGIGFTLLIWTIGIQVINRLSKRTQTFVYGRNIRTPTLNLAAVFLSGGQNRVPGRNFARFLLIMLLMWCLVIRTCYQSELFKYLQADLRKPGIRTHEELYKNGFVLYGNRKPEYGPITKELENGRLKFISWNASIYESLNIVAEPANKATVLIFPSLITKLHNVAYRSGFSSISTLEEKNTQVYGCAPFNLFSPYFEAFNEKIHQLLSNGVSDFHFKAEIQPSLVKRAKEEIGPQVLTLEHLGIGFQISLIPLILGGIVFVAELCVPWLKKRFRSIDRFTRISQN